MTSQNALQTYLTDHMAGSVAASDLAKRGADNNDGPLAVFFADLAREIETDRRTLEQIAARYGTASHRTFKGKRNKHQRWALSAARRTLAMRLRNAQCVQAIRRAGPRGVLHKDGRRAFRGDDLTAPPLAD